MRVVALLVALLGALPAQALPPQVLDHGRFEKLRLHLPAAPVKSVVLFLADRDGSPQQAEAMVAEGAMVVGINTPQFLRALEADGGECVYPDGDLENLSHFVQAYAKLPGYRAPILAGDSAGASLAYAALAQAPTGTFSAGLVTRFEPQLALRKPLCPGEGLASKPLADGRGVQLLPRRSLAAPFLALAGEGNTQGATQTFIAQMPAARQQLLKGPSADDVRSSAALAAALRSLSATQKALVPPAAGTLGDLPVVEEPADPKAALSPYLAVFWSGDGGWAGIDKAVSDALNARGIPVVGVDSLRYFWSARTPEGIARDIEKISAHYLAAWQKQKVILIGYSQGADVLPFAVNQLAPATRSRIALVAAMGLSDHAVFEFELGNWVRDNNDGPATLPEVARLKALPFVCIYGAEEEDSICPRLPRAANLRAVKMPGGHHFDGDYEQLAAVIFEALTK